MQSYSLYSEFNKKEHQSNHPPIHGRGADTYEWADCGIESAKVLSENMLVKEIASQKTEKDPRVVEMLSVYLCYNWTTKTEFILVRSVLQETYHHYTPQYGRDDNYETSTRGDYSFLAFSVEAFKRDKPELARCLQRVEGKYPKG
jgi:hypothetical protein